VHHPGTILEVNGESTADRDLAEVVTTLRGKPDTEVILVLDMRGNTGGYLKTANRIAGMFLPRGSLIATTRARGDEKARYETDTAPTTDVPVVILLDGGAASATEILAGALQHHGRAKLVGERTYGKGSVQNLYELKATRGKTAARLTIARWHLPSGRTVESDAGKPGGLEPDVRAARPESDYWKDAEVERLRGSGKIEDYVERVFREHRARLTELAENDGGQTARYPESDALHGALETKLADVQLQRALLEACRAAGIDPAAVAEYSAFK